MGVDLFSETRWLLFGLFRLKEPVLTEDVDILSEIGEGFGDGCCRIKLEECSSFFRYFYPIYIMSRGRLNLRPFYMFP